jgi:hypothetical protein
LVPYIVVRASNCFPNLEGQDTLEWNNDSHKYSADVLFAISTKEECRVIPHIFARFEVGCLNVDDYVAVVQNTGAI